MFQEHHIQEQSSGGDMHKKVQHVTAELLVGAEGVEPPTLCL